MHVKFATLRDKHTLEAWIYELEPLHGSKYVCMEEKDWMDSASHMKMAVNSTSWMDNSASPMKITIDSTSCINNSVSQMSFP